MSYSKKNKTSELFYTPVDNNSHNISHILYNKFWVVLSVIFIGLIVNFTLRLDLVLLHSNIGEVSITELLQQILLIVTSGSFAYLANKRSEMKHAAVLVSAFFAVMFIREMDFWFDKITHGAWFVPAALVAGSAIFYAVKNGKRTIYQLTFILASPHMNLLLTGLMLLLVFSRLFGMGSFWHNVMGDDYVRAVKNIAEEGTELLAYCLIAFASLKTVHGITKKK